MGIGDASILIGLVTTVVLVGIAVGDIRRQVHTLVAASDKTQEWLKEIQLEVNTNTNHITELKTIVKTRAEMETS